MTTILMAIGVASLAWFMAAAVLFFNPPVDKLYRTEEEHPAVRSLPQEPKTIGMILAAVVAQCVLWAWVFVVVEPALPVDVVPQGIVFGLVICAVKIVPRDIDRMLLTTYPPKRMTIEFVVGIVCAMVVGLVFAWLL